MADGIFFKRGQKHANRVRQARSRITPEFSAILTMITRELMSHRPMNVYRFCARILEHELDRRTLTEIATSSE
jgi:dihydroorotase